MSKQLKNAEETQAILKVIAEMFPDAKRELDANNNFELLIAVMLSAQTTDKAVNKVTPELFKRYPDASALAGAPLTEVSGLISRIGMYNTKAKNIINTAKILRDKYGGAVPETVPELMELPGVGLKTATVVLGDAFNIPGIAVDTHVERVSKRLGLVRQNANIEQIKSALERKTPKEDWVKTHHRLIFFGRYHCTAKRPNCANCPLFDECLVGENYLR
ncbi:MAG: endonuclease III [Lactobacillales bacterium]|jgi:endonuclease-3|nr:endonuclease III [Lactobacillales bacterium]